MRIPSPRKDNLSGKTSPLNFHSCILVAGKIFSYYENVSYHSEHSPYKMDSVSHWPCELAVFAQCHCCSIVVQHPHLWNDVQNPFTNSVVNILYVCRTHAQQSNWFLSPPPKLAGLCHLPSHIMNDFLFTCCIVTTH